MDVGRHPNIRLLAFSEVETVDGELGNFDITIRKKARYVDEERCTGCGVCAEKCPTTLIDSFNMGLGESKAIYRYFAQGIPSAYTIDAANCRHLQPGRKCGICAKTCQANAVDYTQKDQIINLNAGAVIVATGYDLFDARKISEYGYGQIQDVITALELERLLSASGPTGGHLYRPSLLAMKKKLAILEKQRERLKKKLDKSIKSAKAQEDEKDKNTEQIAEYQNIVTEYKTVAARIENSSKARRIAFIQCVGSRDIRFNRHCSTFCCMHSIKEAMIAIEHDKESEVSVLGMDIRAVGKGFEQYRNRGQHQSGIRFIRSRVAEITQTEDGHPVLWYENTMDQKVQSLTVDLVVLATACQPAKGADTLAKILNIELDQAGYFKNSEHQPQDTTRAGIFICGCAKGPADIPESVAQASGAAARVAQVLLL